MASILEDKESQQKSFQCNFWSAKVSKASGGAVKVVAYFLGIQDNIGKIRNGCCSPCARGAEKQSSLKHLIV